MHPILTPFLILCWISIRHSLRIHSKGGTHISPIFFHAHTHTLTLPPFHLFSDRHGMSSSAEQLRIIDSECDSDPLMWLKRPFSIALLKRIRLEMLITVHTLLPSYCCIPKICLIHANRANPNNHSLISLIISRSSIHFSTTVISLIHIIALSHCLLPLCLLTHNLSLRLPFTTGYTPLRLFIATHLISGAIAI